MSGGPAPITLAQGASAVLRAPRVTGRFRDGGAFDARAKSAILGMDRASLIDLDDVDFSFRQSGGPGMRIRSISGELDQVQATLSFDRDVTISAPNGRKFTLGGLVIDLRDGRLRDIRPTAAQGLDGPTTMIIQAMLMR